MAARDSAKRRLSAVLASNRAGLADDSPTVLQIKSEVSEVCIYFGSEAPLGSRCPVISKAGSVAIVPQAGLSPHGHTIYQKCSRTRGNGSYRMDYAML